jgi:hypothetical protein
MVHTMICRFRTSVRNQSDKLDQQPNTVDLELAAFRSGLGEDVLEKTIDTKLVPVPVRIDLIPKTDDHTLGREEHLETNPNHLCLELRVLERENPRGEIVVVGTDAVKDRLVLDELGNRETGRRVVRVASKLQVEELAEQVQVRNVFGTHVWLCLFIDCYCFGIHFWFWFTGHEIHY